MASTRGILSCAEAAAQRTGRATNGARLSLAERDRRWNLLSDEMRASGFDALIFVAADKRGQKGPLRYVADYDLAGRHGYAVLAAETEPVCVLPRSMAGLPRSAWVKDYRFPLDTASGLCEIVSELSSRDRVGIVGRDSIMAIGEYNQLCAALPGTEFLDATEAFDRMRAIKSPEEIAGLQEAAWIADECQQRLLEVARPGMTERALNAALVARMAELAGEDPIFLVMSERAGPGGQPLYRVPREEIVAATDLLMFSIELVGPMGYWVELCRMVTFAPPSEAQRRVHQSVVAAMEAGSGAMRPGAALDDVQRGIQSAATQWAARPGYWSGHAIGHDVIEEGWIGLDVVQSSDAAKAVTHVDVGMAFALHPWLVPETNGPIGYMANTYVVGENGPAPLSRHPLDLATIG